MATTEAARRIQGSERAELAEELRKRVSGEVRFDPFSRVLYSTDASIYQMEPVGVVIPRNEEDVQAVVEIARDNRVPVLPRAGGTGLAGQSVNHAIVMDFSKYLNQVVELNREESWVKVQPGIVLDQLNRYLAAHGLQYAPDPTTSNRACVGGGIGNNTCGAHSVIYGKTLDHIMEVDVVLSDATRAHFETLEPHELEARLRGEGLESDIYRGVLQIARENLTEIETRYPKIMRRVSGYNLDSFLGEEPVNLTKMVVGSEGTLCVVTEAKVNLVPRPTMTCLSVLHFRDIFEASEATVEVLKHEPSSVEVLDKMVLDRSRESMGQSRNLAFVQGDPGAMLLVEFYGESEAELTSKMQKLKDDMEGRRLAYACVNMLSRADQDMVWNVRKGGLGLLMSIRGDAKPIPFVEDPAVDPEKMGDFVRRFDEVVRNHNTTAGYYGHASVGCLHIRPLISLKSAEGVEKMISIGEEISDLVKEFGGSMSGEHGDGIVRGVWTEKMFGPDIYQAFRDLKSTFDPQGIMNPGKIIDCPPMRENLRYGSEYNADSLIPILDFSMDTNYAGAVEMCNGMGACRKLTGTMCPSFMATRDEEHSTRGRANLLRAALSGKLPEGTITDQRLYQAMDLCLECKACKSECESGVDMAKLKYEFLDNYYKTNKRPFRNKFFAQIARYSRMGSRFAPLANLGTSNPVGKFLSSAILGVHPNRELPKLATTTLTQWFNYRHTSRVRGTPKGSVALFNDTFMNYNYPEIGIAAVEVLEAAGYRVQLAEAECCGRPMISKGMLEDAASFARYNVDRLYPFADQGVPIIGCEPSCLLTFRDEYPEFCRDERAVKVAEHSFLIDEFLAMLHERGELDLEFTDLKKKVLFHGHCHQKSLVGTAPSMAALKLPPGYEVELINSGCCGMAGSFGFEKEHYDISMSIGEQVLFPTIRERGADWEVAVMGVSCRQQVEHGTGRPARHLVEVLRDAIV
ncbi:MAG: FAD-binding protein [Chloroflexi bacterium]|nr:FAD-binding protein [Chloroflexota bacterium]